jgi:acyl dehydratase
MGDKANVLDFNAPPSFWSNYRKAIFGSRPGPKPGMTLPEIKGIWSGVRANAEQLASYRKVCGIEDDGVLPILYPNVLTLGIQLSMLVHPAFPLKMLGTVHNRNHVFQRRAIRPDEAMDVVCSINDSRILKQGVEFDVVTRVTIGGEPVWESISGYLSRAKFTEFGQPSPLAQLPELAEPVTESSLRIAPDLGRRYAKVTGDYNPIHISNILAKVFGFPRAIIHGMWSAANGAARVQTPPKDAPSRYDVIFKGPVFIGSDTTLKVNSGEGGVQRFDLFCGKNPRPCMLGCVRPATDSDTLLS